jgi:hypothetical protein
VEALQGDVPSTDCQAFGRHSAAILKFSPAGMLTLWQAMTGGLDWASVMSPLLEPHPHQSDCAVVDVVLGILLFLAFCSQRLAIVEDQWSVCFFSAVLLIVTFLLLEFSTLAELIGVRSIHLPSQLPFSFST